MTTLKTSAQVRAERRNAAIVKEWEKLTANPANSRSAVAEHLAKKHDVHITTVYEIIRNHGSR